MNSAGELACPMFTSKLKGTSLSFSRTFLSIAPLGLSSSECLFNGTVVEERNDPGDETEYAASLMSAAGARPINSNTTIRLIEYLDWSTKRFVSVSSLTSGSVLLSRTREAERRRD